MKRKHILIILVITLLLIAIIVIPNIVKNTDNNLAQNKTEMKRPGKGNTFAKNDNSVFSVRTQEAKIGELQDYIETNGDVIVDSTVAVYPYVSGKLVSLKTQLGSKVIKGQVIAEIDPSSPGASYSLNQVYAPVNGTVLSISLSEGSTVNTNSQIATIGNLDSNGIQVETHIPEKYVGLLKTGLKAEIKLQAYPDEIFNATVTRVSPVLDSSSRTKDIRLSFNNLDSRINVGMFASIKLYTVKYNSCIIIPETAIISSSNSHYVFVTNGDNSVEKREIEIGVNIDGYTEVKTGLQENEVVVIEGTSLLTNGAKIKDITENKQ